RPIVVTIETKTMGDAWQAARLQVGVWQMAQWRTLVALPLRCPADRDQKSRDKKVQDMLDEVDFLPVIIVQGHDWWFVTSTIEGSKTTLWTKKLLASTSDARGIYQIVCTLQYLATWSRHTYWPWFARRILKVELE
ncbi:hypothetical protein B0H67DRAFT_495049, partial [Lasiosphaeris hirsuta]